jgi:hypothetical protein
MMLETSRCRGEAEGQKKKRPEVRTWARDDEPLGRKETRRDRGLLCIVCFVQHHAKRRFFIMRWNIPRSILLLLW